VVAEWSNSFNSNIDWTIPRLFDRGFETAWRRTLHFWLKKPRGFVRLSRFRISDRLTRYSSSIRFRLRERLRRLIYTHTDTHTHTHLQTAWAYSNPLFRGRLLSLSGHQDHHHHLSLDLSWIQISCAYIDINCDLCDMFIIVCDDNLYNA
jgi:hypothetical protein